MLSKTASALPSPITQVISDLRQSPERLVLIQDGHEITTTRMLELYERVSDQLSRSSCGRAAVLSNRADALIAAILAAHEQKLELLLLRTANAVTESVLHSWNVEVLLDEKLQLVWSCSTSQFPNRPAVLIQTSGTTGNPKVTLHDFDSLLSRVSGAKSGPAGGARWLLTYHPASFAGLQVILTALTTSSELVASQHGGFADLREAASRHLITHASGTPTFWRAFLLAGSEVIGIPLKQVTIGGEAVDQPLLEQLHEAFPHARIVHIYASTEAGALFSVTDGCAGFPARWLRDGIEGVKLRIRDQVLEVVSPRAMRGYIGAQSVNRTDDGWLITGDVVEVQGERVYFRGRLDDVINVGGAKVLPEEVEQTLRLLPIVREIRVSGKPNPLVGALVSADVVIAEGVPEQDARRIILQFASERLERYKVPQILNFVTQITVTTSGKKARK